MKALLWGCPVGVTAGLDLFLVVTFLPLQLRVCSLVRALVLGRLLPLQVLALALVLMLLLLVQALVQVLVVVLVQVPVQVLLRLFRSASKQQHRSHQGQSTLGLTRRSSAHATSTRRRIDRCTWCPLSPDHGCT